MPDLKEKSISLLSSTSGVDLNAASPAETSLYSPPTGKNAIITHVVIRGLSATAAVAVVTFGKTGGTCDEFRGDQTLSGLTGSTTYTVIYLDQAVIDTPEAGVIITSSDTFGVEITTPQGGAVTCVIDTFGYLY